MFPRNYCPIYLYIPIWFYSNFNISLVHFGNFIFFTFQSGSIQIVEQLQHEYASGILYIPIWFYSNAIYDLFATAIINFTFQSGSIQIIHTQLVVYYLDCFTFQSGSIQIIPTLLNRTCLNPLHSNLVLFKYGHTQAERVTRLSFTFQSGSIQIIPLRAP